MNYTALYRRAAERVADRAEGMPYFEAIGACAAIELAVYDAGPACRALRIDTYRTARIGFTRLFRPSTSESDYASDAYWLGPRTRELSDVRILALLFMSCIAEDDPPEAPE